MLHDSTLLTRSSKTTSAEKSQEMPKYSLLSRHCITEHHQVSIDFVELLWSEDFLTRRQN